MAFTLQGNGCLPNYVKDEALGEEPEAWVKARESLKQINSSANKEITAKANYNYWNTVSGIGYFNFGTNSYSTLPVNSDNYGSAMAYYPRYRSNNILSANVAQYSRMQMPYAPPTLTVTHNLITPHPNTNKLPVSPQVQPQVQQQSSVSRQLDTVIEPVPGITVQPSIQDDCSNTQTTGGIKFQLPKSKSSVTQRQQPQQSALAFSTLHSGSKDVDQNKRVLYSSDKSAAFGYLGTRSNAFKAKGRDECNIEEGNKHSSSSPRQCSSAVTCKQMTTQATSTPTQCRSAQDWPESLKNYVNRAFARCSTDFDKDRAERILKEKLTLAYNKGNVWTTDWDMEPLPSEIDNVVNNSSYDKKGKSGNKNTQRSRSRSESGSSLSDTSSGRSGAKTKKSSWYNDANGNDADFIPVPSKKSKQSFSAKLQNKKSKKENKKKQKNRDQNQSSAKMIMDSICRPAVNPEIIAKRKARFDVDECVRNTVSNVITEDGFSIDLKSATPIVGTCEDLEKQYLRLTSAPDPATVRPVHVLRKSLESVKDHWIRNHDYYYACDQLKSIRQDLTVQFVRNSFTVEVYETHARIALEKGDREEFNQCQSQLQVLYNEVDSVNKAEFTGYLILYTIFSDNHSGLQLLLSKINNSKLNDEVINHALTVRRCWSLKNYSTFFKLYLKAPKMSGFVIDWFVNRERKYALKAMLKAYRPTLPLQFLKDELAFANNDEFQQFLSQFSITYANSEAIDCKLSAVVSV